MRRSAAPVVMALLAGTAGLLPTAQAASAITLSSVSAAPGATFDGSGYTLGFEFQLSAPVRVLSLGVYDHGRDGLEAAADVGLWSDDGAVALLASATVAGGSAAALDGYFRYAAITPLLLLPGTRYVVGAALNGALATSLGIGEGNAGAFDPRVQAVIDRSWDQGFDFPLGSDGVAGGAWLGANFQLAAVPEPAAPWLWAAGLLGLLGWRHGPWRRQASGRGQHRG